MDQVQLVEVMVLIVMVVGNVVLKTLKVAVMWVERRLVFMMLAGRSILLT